MSKRHFRPSPIQGPVSRAKFTLPYPLCVISAPEISKPPVSQQPTSAFTSQDQLFTNLREAAQHWFGFGFKLLPIHPRQKIPATAWDPWMAKLSKTSIEAYWGKNPDHEIACLVGNEFIVFDADTQQAEDALVALEAKFGMSSRLVVKTRKGTHHYYRRQAGSRARSDSQSTEKYPERIDVKTGRSLAMLPCSTDKVIALCGVQHASELSIASQEFMDAVCIHNGRTPPQPPVNLPDEEVSACTDIKASNVEFSQLERLVMSLDPDMGYEDWTHVLMAIHYETDGSDVGLALADRWSSKGDTYKGIKEIETKWRSFKADAPTQHKMGTLIWMARNAGIDTGAIIHPVEAFEFCETETIYPPGHPALAPVASNDASINPLLEFSLRGRTAELEQQAVDQKPILGDIVLQGQATVIYAPPNSGKTLIVLFEIINSIKARRFDPDMLFYLNMDDNSVGLVEKNRLAEEYGFHMLADGHRGFKGLDFPAAMETMIEKNTAKGVIVILDTIKKFVNTMDKTRSSAFSRVVRRFVMKGGTVIALAHTNKNPGQDGNVVFAGTSDIRDDFDCCYTLAPVSKQSNDAIKVVEFQNIKKRGAVPQSVAYSYAEGRDVAYSELLLSVEKVESEQLETMPHGAELPSDTPIIAAVESCIDGGVNTKMKLADAVAVKAKVSKRTALRVIEKYTGSVVGTHLWAFVVRDRGAKVFERLPGIQTESSIAAG